MSYTLDSNLLLRSIQADHPQQGEALGLINKLVARGESVYLLPQVFYEFWVVATRPKGKENGLGLSAVEADAILTKFASVFPIVHDTPEVFRQWRTLVCKDAVLGKNAHDARLAAAILAHGIEHFVTFNKEHFKRFSGVDTILPSEL